MPAETAAEGAPAGVGAEGTARPAAGPPAGRAAASAAGSLSGSDATPLSRPDAGSLAGPDAGPAARPLSGSDAGPDAAPAARSLAGPAAGPPAALSAGLWSMLGETRTVAALAGSGFDWLCLDAQHGHYDDAAMRSGLDAVAAASPALERWVRVRSADPGLIGRALDAGADGVIVPLVDSAEQAAAAVRASYYPPLGARSTGPTLSAPRAAAAPAQPAAPVERVGGPGAGAAAAAAAANGTAARDDDRAAPVYTGPRTPGQVNASVRLAIMIETPQALEELEAIASTPGVSCLFVGPFDLALSLGTTVPALLADESSASPLTRVVAAARTAGVTPGAFGGDPATARALAARGFTFVAATTDTAALAAGAATLRAALD
ncbi:aldolase/citrate lyase family protein [Herbiconiux sp. 11R-BC]|uniref:HpcH/HpaI aldolase family protein n=1 Tax=Herbiconiux sp. 11R-BC TaxID=3111637 RepID=UPI003C002A85